MIREAERAGVLPVGGTIVECTSGDLGVSIAAIGRRLGYRVVLVMPECGQNARVALSRALGAEIQFTPRELGMRAAIELTEALQKRTPGAICLQPFTSKANAEAHASSTALEIWNDTNGQVAVVVAAIGTGGTAAGCAMALRDKGVKIVGVEPAASQVMRGGAAGPHDIAGIGAGFVPEILPPRLLDEVIAVACADARAQVRRLALEEGLLCGPASGAVVTAAIEVARRSVYSGRMVVAVLPDSAEHHLDHSAFLQED